MKVQATPVQGVLLLSPHIWRDDRGAFHESFHAERYRAAGIEGSFVQDNISTSRYGVIRGLHFQHPHAQAKLVSAVHGSIFDVVVDVRIGSPTFGQWFGHELSADAAEQIYVPAGCAHGFQVLSSVAVFSYKCSAYYAPVHERTIRWNDAELGIDWPLPDATLSPRDRAAESLAEVRDRGQLPPYVP